MEIKEKCLNGRGMEIIYDPKLCPVCGGYKDRCNGCRDLIQAELRELLRGGQGGL